MLRPDTPEGARLKRGSLQSIYVIWIVVWCLWQHTSCDYVMNIFGTPRCAGECNLRVNRRRPRGAIRCTTKFLLSLSLVVCSILTAIVSRRWSTISPSYALTTRCPTAYWCFKIVPPHTHHSSLEDDMTKKGGTCQSNSKASTIEHISSTSKLSTWSGRVWSEQHSRILFPAWGLLLLTDLVHCPVEPFERLITLLFVEDHSTTLPTHPSHCCFRCKCCMHHL